MNGLLKSNLDRIQDELNALKNKVSHGQSPTIIAVSKKQPIDKIYQMLSLGIRDFGENYVQEFLQKYEEFRDTDICWHFIGALQSKKIKEIVGKSDLIHSVSRQVEVEKISRHAQDMSVVQDYLVQVNIAGEATKSGVAPNELSDFVSWAVGQPSCRLRGLMVFPPLESAAEKSMEWFQKGRLLFDEIGKSGQATDWNILSMGTSSDYPLAYQQGATLLRLGECLMGPRSQ